MGVALDASKTENIWSELCQTRVETPEYYRASPLQCCWVFVKVDMNWVFISCTWCIMHKNIALHNTKEETEEEICVKPQPCV